jgi:hypothetical protein
LTFHPDGRSSRYKDKLDRPKRNCRKIRGESARNLRPILPKFGPFPLMQSQFLLTMIGKTTSITHRIWHPPARAQVTTEERLMSLGSLLLRFLGNRDAGVAPMMALAALPLFGAVGAAVDYSRAASARTAMQAALEPPP